MKNRPEVVEKLTDAHRAYVQALRDGSISEAEVQARGSAFDDALSAATENEERSSYARLRKEGFLS